MIEFITKFWIEILTVALISYLLGSVNFSIIVTRKIQKEVDIRNVGSGNAGFTNVLRSVGKLAAVLAFVGDILKLAIAIYLSRLIFSRCTDTSLPNLYVYQIGAYIAGICCTIGHIYPCFFKFKGGKGVLTLAAMIFFIDLRVFLVLFFIFSTVFLFTRIISLCSIVAAMCYPVVTFIISYIFDYSFSSNGFSILYVFSTTLIAFAVTLLVIYKHKDNIKRLKKGKEQKISIKSLKN